MTDFHGSYTMNCKHCGRPFNTAEGAQCDCGEEICPKTKESAWLAGYDCEKNGATTENCHFSFFATPELTKSWEAGKKAFRWERDKKQGPPCP